jgi:hypothetical protein
MVMVVHPIHAVIVQVQRRISQVVMVVLSVVRLGLGMDPGVVEVAAYLRLTQRREPHQALPKQGKHQEGGARASGHGDVF